MSLKDRDHWMQDVHPHKGALHRALGVPEGEKIPEKKHEAAAHSKNPHVRKMEALAKVYAKARK